MRTHQYRDIIAELCDCKHLSASTIFECVQKHHPKIGRATVYRNIEEMTRDGILRKIPSAHGCNHYEKVRELHAHLLDEHTHQLSDFPMENISVNNIPDGYEIAEVCVYIRKKIS